MTAIGRKQPFYLLNIGRPERPLWRRADIKQPTGTVLHINAHFRVNASPAIASARFSTSALSFSIRSLCTLANVQGQLAVIDVPIIATMLYAPYPAVEGGVSREVRIALVMPKIGAVGLSFTSTADNVSFWRH